MLDSVAALLEEHIKDLYSAENQLVKALPGLVRVVRSPELKQAISSHLKETQGHVERLEKIARELDIKPGGKKCKGMEGLIAEGKEVAGEDGDESAIDAAIVSAAQKVEHYEIAAYGTARTLAQRLGNRRIMDLLDATLEEEKAADEKLTQISTGTLLPAMSLIAEED